MASDGRYMYYSDYPPYAAPPSYEPPRPIRSDSGSSSSQPPHSPEQQSQHHSSQQFSNHNHSRPQPSYGPPPQQQYAPAPTYMSPAAPAPPQQWTQNSWGQQSYVPPPPPETQQYNTAPPPPARPASNEHQQRTWNHPSYAPPPPPPPESHHYSPPPTRPRSDEPQQRVYAPPPLPPPDSPNTRPSHGRGQPPSAPPTYHQPPSHPQPPSHHQPHPHPTPPQAASHRIRRRRELTPQPPPPPPPAIVPEPTPEPVAYAPYSSPAANAIDFNKLMDSYRPILQAGRTLATPRAADGTVDSMLQNAFYAAQVLEGASSGSSHATQYQHRTRPPVVRGSPITAQQPPPMQHYPQLQRVHSASTVSSGSDIAHPPSQLPPTTRSPPRPDTSSNPRAKNLSPRQVKAKIKIDSPGNDRATPGLHGHTHIGGIDGAPTMSSSPSKPSKSQKLEGSGPSVADAGVARTQDTHHSGGSSTQKCLGCGATATPEWRRGPLGPRTLCNACGLVYAKLVKKRLRESGGGGRVVNGYSSRSGPNPREESPEAGSEEDDEERSYDHPNMPGR